MEKETQLRLEDLPEAKEVVSDRTKNLKSYTNFSQKQFMSRHGGKLHGRWSSSFAGACTHGFPNFIQEGSLISLTEVGRCDSGAIIVRAEHY